MCSTLELSIQAQDQVNTNILNLMWPSQLLLNLCLTLVKLCLLLAKDQINQVFFSQQALTDTKSLPILNKSHILKLLLLVGHKISYFLKRCRHLIKLMVSVQHKHLLILLILTIKQLYKFHSMLWKILLLQNLLKAHRKGVSLLVRDSLEVVLKLHKK